MLVELSKIGYKDGVIVMKGKAFGSMPQAMRLTGEQIAYILGMVPFELVAHLPKILFDGWRATRKASEEEK